MTGINASGVNVDTAIFEATRVMMPANKPALADAIWALIPRDVIVWRVSGAPSTVAVTYVGSAQSTSPEIMDMPLLSSTGIRKDYLRKMVPMNAAQVEEKAQQWIAHGIWS